MKKFSNFITEMARKYNMPLSATDYNRAEARESYHKSEKTTKLIGKVKPNMKLYQNINFFFLKDKGDKYIAYVNGFEEKYYYNGKQKQSYIIREGNSSFRGKYIMLLSSITLFTKNEFIFSDMPLSDGAVKFWEKILKGSVHDAFILGGRPIIKPKKNEEGIDGYFNDFSRIGFSTNKKLYENPIKNVSFDEDDKIGVYNTDNKIINTLYGYFEEL